MSRKEGQSQVLFKRLSEKSDIELVKIAKLQLPYVTSAYEVLFKRYRKQLVQLCFRYLGSIEEAEEAASDTLMIMFNKINQFEERSSFKTWIYKVAYHQSLSQLRTKKLDYVDSFDEQAEFDSEKQVATSLDEEKQIQLDKLLNTLSLDEKTIIVFRMTGQLEFTEIAEILDKKLSAVKMQYKRALEKLTIEQNSDIN